MNIEKGKVVLSLFDGMSCGRIALERAGIKVDKYYASEVDKYSIKVSESNYADIIQLGDVKNIHYTNHGLEIDESGSSMRVIGTQIDLLIGGSPCQGFSYAGKQLNFEDPRSKLFFEYVRLLREILLTNPNVKFMLENVCMKKEYQDIISENLGVQPVLINSSLVSAQNRKRLYWTNIHFSSCMEDKGILLSDILQNMDFDKYSEVTNTNPSGRGMNGKIHPVDKKSPCLTTNKGEGIKIGCRIVGRRKNEKGIRCDNDKSCRVKQILEINGDPNKSNSLMSQYDQSKNGTFLCVDCNGNVSADKTGTITSRYGKGVENFGSNPYLSDGIRYRKLTPIECERLQTVPDDYTSCVSNSQRYKMLGNGWTIDVIAHIFKNII